jgi:hypothetical protein
MARPLDLVLDEMLDYICQATVYVRDMTFEQSPPIARPSALSKRWSAP